MGLFNFLTNELIEVIEWLEPSEDIVMWKFPDKQRDIKYGAQLTVMESQAALFINEGQIADLYQAGRHKLVTENMPILTKLKSWMYGFESPFKTDVYYFSMRQFTDMKWGTGQPVMLRDPQFKMVRVQAYGVYFMRITDPAKFFKEFSGTREILYAKDFEERMRDIIVPKFAEALAEAQVSVLDITSNLSEIGEKVKPFIQADFDAFGVELTKFQIAGVSLPPEVQEFYDKMTSMNMVDDMNRYQQFTTVNALEESAKNGGGGGAGIDIGSALVFNNLIQQNQQNLQQNKQPIVQAPESKEQILNTLKELGQLKEAGILTEDEFAKKKAELLAKL